MSQGKHHSWVELYFDLVFVFAVGQLTHLIVAHSAWSTVALALALFVMLWWTWIGFVVHYNRHGEDRRAERLFLIAGTVPCAIAAIEVYDAHAGNLATFALAIAGARLVLALAYLSVSDDAQRTARPTALAYLAAAGMLALSAALPPVWQYAVWAVTLVWESTMLLSGAQRTNVALDARHLAERFNLFMIIMLGEVVISVSAAAIGVASHQAGYWLGLFAGLILAGALWWIYFDSAAEINAIVLHASGGHPAQAYAIYAMGYLLPAFAVLVLAAGCGLALQQSPPGVATWYVTLGLAAYLIGVRGFEFGRHGRKWHMVQVGIVALTIGIALLNRVLAGPLVVAIAAVWAVTVAAAMSGRRREPAQAW